MRPSRQPFHIAGRSHLIRLPGLLLAAMASGQLFVDLDQPLAPWSPVYGTPPREAPPWLMQV